ncbi:MAG: ABC transporter ATP-binding protein [Acidobacteria bacterium]|nr:ABC transporter ATP-binding protein [Acidobacteriota bacterium]MCG3192117.1 Vitamin B12 import ATP-binding protein BtuD [Thermoanaerobaculia bacterium]MCK6683676.1 ABC transporter ATP-binding protein [Thermoanaerobaculia bacterium]
MAAAAVEARSLSKHYRRWNQTRTFGTLKSAFLGLGFSRALSPGEVVAALEDVSFSVEPGETFGVVGANGSGKSTLLKLVAGILKPNSGSLAVNGKVSALIELGAGFHPEISGRENVVINGIMLGLTRKEIEKKLPSIIEFSGLSEFIDQPVKTYSSGMYVRLGFAVAIHTDPSILVVDEVLAVGDEAFAHRCLDTIREFSARGKTIFFVTHSLALVEELCDRVLYLEKGKVKGIGDAREILSSYRLDVSAQEGERLAAVQAVNQEELRQASAAPVEIPSEASSPAAPETPTAEEKPRRWGDRSAIITACRVLDRTGAERYAFQTGETLTIEIEGSPQRPLDDFVFGIGLFTTEDFCIHGTNTDIDGFMPERFDGPAKVHITLPACTLGAGTYLVDVAIHSRRGTPYDYWRGACRFRMDSPRQDAGVYCPDRNWNFLGAVRWK